MHITAIADFMSLLRSVSKIPPHQTAVLVVQRRLASVSWGMLRPLQTQHRQVHHRASIGPAFLASFWSSSPTSMHGTRQLQHPHQACKRFHTPCYRYFHFDWDCELGSQ